MSQKRSLFPTKNRRIMPRYLLVFDGNCMLCNRFVQRILQKDRTKKFTFSTLQGLPTSIDQSGLQSSIQDSISYLRNDTWFQKSTAVLYIYQDLFGRFHWSQIAWLCPKLLRDLIYDLIAKHRYKWFGKNESCYLPLPEDRTRFIG
jgi:predicted DCC family thiol-disulfide oxidoreductase YuxK